MDEHATPTAVRRGPPASGRTRVVVEAVTPAVADGRFAVKRIAGDEVTVEADVFADGHDELTVVLLWRADRDEDWHTTPMHALGNDRWRGSFMLGPPGMYRFAVRGWVDRFATWRRDLAKRAEAGQDLSPELAAGAEIVERVQRRAEADDRRRLRAFAAQLREGAAPDGELASLMQRYGERRHAVTSGEYPVWADRERARFGAWYELFPRSCGPGDRHGTFADVALELERIAAMGFDVVYLPPIHPIGRTKRKGRNNTTTAEAGDVGSPWAIGASEGGHTAVQPELGTVDDFDRLVDRARALGMEIALDIAYQCSADHPWLTEHPEWFRRRPDGSLRYAENPPKKYEDIYPIDFETDDWHALWTALDDVVRFWISHGVRIFRVDNPHTKPFAFWEWMISGIRADHPDVIFLSEAFTRPKVMYRLAKIGFTQSYTYFTWRNSKQDLTEYLTELTRPPVVDLFRPNLWPNTPDILHETLQRGGRPAFASRFVLAATLAGNYGMYGPAFELAEGRPVREGSEEYLDSEKYQLRDWDTASPDSLGPLISTVNAIRRAHPAFAHDGSLRFHRIDNDQLIAYSRRHGPDAVLIVVNLDPRWAQSGWTDLDVRELGVEPALPFAVDDQLSGETFEWQGPRNFVRLEPGSAHIFVPAKRRS